jgi:RNA polymerase sigma-70 factor (ECF subfamily)
VVAFDLLRSNSSADEPEWEDLYRRHAADLRRLIARRVPAGAPVDDLLQEAFYQAYRSRDRVDLSQPVWPWLATLAHRVCIAWWRRQPPEGVPWGVDEHVDPAVFPGSDEHLTAIVRGEQVSSALARLSPRHRALLVGHTNEGLSCEHLARFEGSSAKAVKSALNRARTHFRRHLRAEGGHGWGLPVGIVAGMKRWYAKHPRAVPLAEGVGSWAGAVLALGVVATLSITPVAMRTNGRSRAADGRSPSTVAFQEADPRRTSATGTSPRARPAEAKAGLPPVGSAAGRGTRTNVSLLSPALGTRADVTQAPDGVWTLYEVTVHVPLPIVGGSTTVGSSVRCTAGTVSTAICALRPLVPESGQ